MRTQKFGRRLLGASQALTRLRRARIVGAGRDRCASEQGMVTVETALSFVAVMVVVAATLAVGVAGLTRQSLCQAVREGARVASVEGVDPAGAVSHSFARAGAITVTRNGEWVTVSAQAGITVPGGFHIPAARCWASTLVESALVEP